MRAGRRGRGSSSSKATRDSRRGGRATRRLRRSRRRRRVCGRCRVRRRRNDHPGRIRPSGRTAGGARVASASAAHVRYRRASSAARGVPGAAPVPKGERVVRVTARLAAIGADPRDDADTRASKALLVLISVLILPISLVWSGLYVAFGSPVGWVPLGYAAVLLTSIVVFSRTRDFRTFLLVGQIAIVLAPTLSMIPLGGYLDSGGVGLWGILAPLGALVFSDVRSAALWYVAFVVVFLGSGIAGEVA